jgi:hypothetical protein
VHEFLNDLNKIWLIGNLYQKYCENNRMVNFIVQIFSQGFKGKLVYIYLRFIQVSMHFGILYDFLGYFNE